MCCPEAEAAQSVLGPMLSLNLQNLRLRVTLAWSSSMGDLACRTDCGPSCARVAKPSPSVDVVGFFVGFGGGTVLG